MDARAWKLIDDYCDDCWDLVESQNPPEFGQARLKGMAEVTITLGINLNLYRTFGMAETANHVFRQRNGADPCAALIENDSGSSDFNLNPVRDSQGNDMSDRYSMRDTGNSSVYFSGTYESAAVYRSRKGRDRLGAQAFVGSIPLRNPAEARWLLGLRPFQECNEKLGVNNEDPWVRSMKQAPPPRTLREALTRIFRLYTAREMQTLIPTRAGQYGAGVYISPNERNPKRTHTTVQRPISTIQRHLAQARGSRRLAQQSEGEVMEDYLLQAVERGQAYEAGLAMVQAMIDFGILDPLREDPELGYLLEGLRQIGAMREPPVEHAFSLLYAITELLPHALQENLSFLADEDAVNDLADRALDPPDDLMRRREERDRKEAEERSRSLREDPEFEEYRQWKALDTKMKEIKTLEEQGHTFTPEQMASIREIVRHRVYRDQTPEEIGSQVDRLVNEIRGSSAPERFPEVDIPQSVPMKRKHPHHKPKTQPMGWYRSRRR